MKNVKTYEGFLDFFKRKPKSTEPVYMDDIKECGYDFLHDGRIEVYLDFYVLSFQNRPILKRPGGIKHDYDDLFGVKRESDLKPDDIPYIRGNKMVIEFRYNLESEKQDNSVSAKKEKEISKNEMSELIKDFVDKLQTLDCKASFYLAWGYDEGHTDDKEYENIDKMMDVIYKKDMTPLIAMKITAPSDIIVD